MVTKTTFAEQVSLALENLHDYAALQRLPLCQASVRTGETLDHAVRRVRSTLLGAIETLKPGSGIPPRAKEGRPYALLYGRYVQGMSTAELLEELAISVRQLRREHKRALDAVVCLAWDALAPYLDRTSPSLVSSPHNAMAADEVEQLIKQAQPEYLDLWPVVEGILAFVIPLAEARGISFDCIPPSAPGLVLANRIVLRQALLEVLAYALDRAERGELIVGGRVEEEPALWITARHSISTSPACEAGRLHISHRLISSQRGRLSIDDRTGEWRAVLTLPPANHIPVLVIDDNEGLVELLRRYLSGRPYRVMTATTAEQAIRQAHDAKVKVIILDIMMPQQDGWEVLQRLRSAPETRETPVVVCSVLNEPDIAANLGASGYLKKPVTQDSLLAALDQYCPPSTGKDRGYQAAPQGSAGFPSA